MDSSRSCWNIHTDHRVSLFILFSFNRPIHIPTFAEFCLRKKSQDMTPQSQSFVAKFSELAASLDESYKVYLAECDEKNTASAASSSSDAPPPKRGPPFFLREGVAKEIFGKLYDLLFSEECRIFAAQHDCVCYRTRAITFIETSQRKNKTEKLYLHKDSCQANDQVDHQVDATTPPASPLPAPH